MLCQMKDDAEIVIVISAGDIEKNKVRADLGITYDVDVLRLIDAFRGIGLYVGTRRDHAVRRSGGCGRLQEASGPRSACRSILHYPIAGYPANVPLIVSATRATARNEYIETTRPLVVITAPGPGCGQDGDLPQPALP